MQPLDAEVEVEVNVPRSDCFFDFFAFFLFCFDLPFPSLLPLASSFRCRAPKLEGKTCQLLLFAFASVGAWQTPKAYLGRLGGTREGRVGCILGIRLRLAEVCCVRAFGGGLAFRGFMVWQETVPNGCKLRIPEEVKGKERKKDWFVVRVPNYFVYI